MQVTVRLCYGTVCLVCNGVLWPYGWTDHKVPLGTEVGLGPGDIVLDGDPAPPCWNFDLLADKVEVVPDID